MSTHQVQLPGVAALTRWGLLGPIIAAGTPATRALRLDTGTVVLAGNYPRWRGSDALYSPRRLVLDQVLIDAARQAGADVREGFAVEELIWAGGRVTGIAGSPRGHPRVAETAPLVVGADGKQSFVARSAGASSYRVRPAATMASYSYWAALPTVAGGGELYRRPGRAIAVFPTNDALTMVYVAAPAAEFATARHDRNGHYLASLDRCGDLGDRVRAGLMAERLRTTPGWPAGIRVPRGPGWALAGDAGLVLDPVSAYGITSALRDAELLATAIIGGLTGSGGLDTALLRYHRERDKAARPMSSLTAKIARLGPPGMAERVLYAALAGRPAAISRFFGTLAGAEPCTRRDLARIAISARFSARTGPNGSGAPSGAASRG